MKKRVIWIIIIGIILLSIFSIIIKNRLEYQKSQMTEEELDRESKLFEDKIIIKVPEEILFVANNYINNLIDAQFHPYLECVWGYYYDNKIGVEMQDDMNRKSYFINQVKNYSAAITKSIKDEEYGTITVTKYNDEEYSVIYYVTKDIYEFEYVLDFPKNLDYEDVKISFLVDEYGEILNTSNTLRDCQSDQKKCPPFDISKSEALQIMQSITSEKEGHSWDLRLRYSQRGRNGFNGYVWSGNYCPPPYSSPPPPPMGNMCHNILVNAYNGEIV
ncbi:MAG: hypothetical protein KAQ83_01195 [Nanoarchaeota archaeon]|nr:hypothetical protein [Nanoarchaeota archaeon]